MKLFYCISVVLFLYFSWGNAQLLPTESYPHKVVLDQDGTMVLYWKFNDTDITFELYGKTEGWIGIGISPSGGMKGADIFVGWVDGNGAGVITDRHGVSNSFPPLDPVQNLNLLDSSEQDGWTMIKFIRQMAACEEDFDLPITTDTLKIIYAYGLTDPTGADLQSSDYHSPTRRGTRSVLISEIAKSDEAMYPEGETHDSFDILNDRFLIPALPSYYNCRVFMLPEFTQKHHLVKVEAVIEEGNEFNVHHMIAYQCKTPSNNVTEEIFNKDAECYTGNMPPDFENCFAVLHAWAIGGGDFYFPMEAGYPLGDENSPQYIVLETHYDNPTSKAGIVDSSGLRFIYTPDVRTYDSGFLEIGNVVSGFSHLIPPHASSFLSHGECTADCLAQGMKFSQVDEINVFANVLHSHLLGRKLKIRHVRDGVELPYLVKDDAYDFNYQENRYLENMIKIKKGDNLQMICDYHTESKDTMSMGGLDTKREMCIGFIYYYPRMSTVFCQTEPVLEDLISYFGIEKYEGHSYDLYSSIANITITAPEEIANQSVYDYLNSLDWDEKRIKDFENKLATMNQSNVCLNQNTINPGYGKTVPAFHVDVPYVEPKLNCRAETPEPTDKPITTTSSAVKISQFPVYVMMIMSALICHVLG